ncbi:hypothetical protein LWI29_023802 [Acer saccharum]|uniref:Nicastrin n=1 Tax=Acer saccharum TaxID=4024 RepID=A0AA39VY39_ACESA|nr:hypothetical protein LWI29_023802 [Acer saccharum]
MGCLLACDPGLSCELVKNYISPTNACPSHYVGVLLGEPTPKPNLNINRWKRSLRCLYNQVCSSIFNPFEVRFWILEGAAPEFTEPMELVDPVWAESNWNTIGLRVYIIQDATYDCFVLLGGIAVTILAYLAILLTRSFITKALKRD